jgi:hypothetical protein
MSAIAGSTTYRAFFCGTRTSNLPSITPPDEHFEPTWEEEEVKAVLQNVLKYGLQLVHDHAKLVCELP